MERGPCILVFGVSGVGKTSCCKDYVTRHPVWLYFRASTLLSKATGKTTEELRTSSGQAISNNQQLLGAALDRARAGREASPVIIDAHAVIDNDEGLVTVPLDAVASMRADGIILLELPVAKLAARRATADRPRPVRSEAELTYEANMERAAVRDYAARLDLPLVSGKVEGAFVLDPLIDELVRTRSQGA